jgi:hypothetical protein
LHGLDPVVSVEFLVDVLKVCLNCLFREEQPRCNVTIAKTFRYESEDFFFAP